MNIFMRKVLKKKFFFMFFLNYLEEKILLNKLIFYDIL